MTSRSHRVKAAVPIRIRGMSADNKFFDEQTETASISKHEVMTRLRTLIDLETEVHLSSLKNNVGGTFRTTWVNTHNHNGFHDLGLELLEPEGDIWEMDFPPAPAGEEQAAAPVWLECDRCHQRLETSVPEAEEEFVTEGFLVARHCEQCKSTTPWHLTTPADQAGLPQEPEHAAPEPTEPAEVSEKEPGAEHRGKGRAPLKMLIKVIRQKYGTTLEEICETQNVSRGGAYFLSHQSYDVGEELKVIMPYKEGEMGIPVPARVVRQSQIKGSFHKGVAIHLEGKKK